MNEFEFSQITLNDTELHLCSYTEFDPMDFTHLLTEVETERLLSFKHENRRREFVATRILRHRVVGFEHIHYDAHGAPYIDNEGYISISHCRQTVGLAINKAYKIGLDLETPRANILDLKSKFLSENEWKTFNVDDPMEVTKIWSAKEALYKLAGRKKIHFKSELLLSKNRQEDWSGVIINPEGTISVNLNIFEHHGDIISINSDKIVES